MSDNVKSSKELVDLPPSPKITCGVIMPISATDGYPDKHWEDVYKILSEAVEPNDFQLKIVSDANESGIIQRQIVQNLYENDVVICDVSSKNPNVMFELGLRLAFDKPTVVVKDDLTSYTFDTSPIEHVEYPRDLRYGKILSFKNKLAAKVKGTYEAYKKNPDGYSTFLKAFGTYRVPKLDEKEVSKETFFAEKLNDLTEEIRSLKRATARQLARRSVINRLAGPRTDLSAEDVVRSRLNGYYEAEGKRYLSKDDVASAMQFLEKYPDIKIACGSRDRLKELIEAEVIPF